MINDYYCAHICMYRMTGENFEGENFWEFCSFVPISSEYFLCKCVEAQWKIHVGSTSEQSTKVFFHEISFFHQLVIGTCTSLPRDIPAIDF